MTWTDPKTFVLGDPLTAAELNTHLRDNLNALKAPPTTTEEVNEGADYTTASTSFVDVDATDLALEITTTGGDVLIGFFGNVNNAGGATFLDVYEADVLAALLGGDDGFVKAAVAVNTPVAFTFLKTGLAAGTYTFNLRWKVTAGTATMYAGAGTVNNDLHPQFWVREI